MLARFLARLFPRAGKKYLNVKEKKFETRAGSINDLNNINKKNLTVIVLVVTTTTNMRSLG